MSFIYLASPYTHEDSAIMQERYEKAVDAVKHFATNNIVVYSPIVHFHVVAVKHQLPRDRDFWERQNFGMLDKAFALVILTLPGWENSQGIQGEFKRAYTLGKHVGYLTPEDMARTIGEEYVSSPGV